MVDKPEAVISEARPTRNEIQWETPLLLYDLLLLSCDNLNLDYWNKNLWSQDSRYCYKDLHTDLSQTVGPLDRSVRNNRVEDCVKRKYHMQTLRNDPQSCNSTSLSCDNHELSITFALMLASRWFCNLFMIQHKQYRPFTLQMFFRVFEFSLWFVWLFYCPMFADYWYSFSFRLIAIVHSG